MTHPRPAPYGAMRQYTELYTSDQHFGDPRAVGHRRYSSGKADTNAYDRETAHRLALTIIAAAEKAPTRSVRLHVLGDISSGRTHVDTLHGNAMFNRVRAIVEDERPGTDLIFVLYAGNHDSCSQMQPWGIERQPYFLREADTGDGPGGSTGAFDVITDSAQLRLQLGDGTHQDVLVAHLPYWRIGDGKERFEKHGREPRFQQWRLQDMGLPMIHGHSHSKDKHVIHDGGTDLSSLCVSMDAWPERLVADMADITTWITAWRAASTPVPGVATNTARTLPESSLYDWSR